MWAAVLALAAPHEPALTSRYHRHFLFRYEAPGDDANDPKVQAVGYSDYPAYVAPASGAGAAAAP